jgi:hypothetical protein
MADMCELGTKLYDEWKAREERREFEIAKAHVNPNHDCSGDAIEFKPLIDSAHAAEREFRVHFRSCEDCREIQWSNTDTRVG